MSCILVTAKSPNHFCIATWIQSSGKTQLNSSSATKTKSIMIILTFIFYGVLTGLIQI